MTADVSVTRDATELDLAFSSERAFREWYDRTLPRVYGYVLGHTAGDAELAQEITQQTFVAALRGHRLFDGRSEASTWLCAIARNKLVDHYRRLDRQERRQLRLAVEEIDMGVAEAPWAAMEDRASVEAVLASMPAMQRAALVFFHVDGLSTREIAGLLGRGEDAVESLLRRARATFRRGFGEQDAHG
jgi:RNA polymerase sigma-70 factor (ECF subfamily)